MKVHAKKIIGRRFVTAEGKGGKVDDLFFDVRTGDITHISLALTGWYRGNTVLLQLDSCSVLYSSDGVISPQLSLDAIRQAPLLDKEAVRNAEITELLIQYEDTAPRWSLSGRCCVTQTRSESVQEKTGQTALWGTRDLLNAPVHAKNEETAGTVDDLIIDTDLWRVTHLIVRTGKWYRPTRLEVPVDFLFEIESSSDSADVVLNHAID